MSLVLLEIIICLRVTDQYINSKPRLLESPKDKVVRVEGETVVLRCQVLNRHGDVIWCRNRFCTLGRPDPKIGQKGSFDLVIRNFTKKDSGEYRCQVLGTTQYPSLISEPAMVVLYNGSILPTESGPYRKPLKSSNLMIMDALKQPHLSRTVIAITILQIYLTLLIVSAVVFTEYQHTDHYERKVSVFVV